ncbi:hypothetical protein D9757_011295 [Collybiopsis confluens]|uniref:DUF6534 domain-containing protein n=1 Tax=Collybiopsis confluens TaxID=2823264 RepID=A0A8H5LSV6_9AGAR|nr:hypothetical protein D9757_011295 [Collybiopsis confluens]
MTGDLDRLRKVPRSPPFPRCDAARITPVDARATHIPKGSSLRYYLRLKSDPSVVFGVVLDGDFLITVHFEPGIYFRSFKNDPARVKILVSYLLIIATAQLALNMHDAFVVFGSHFGDVDELTAVNLQWLYVPILTVMASFPVQFFYAHRMILFSRSYYTKAVAAIVVSLGFIATVASIINGVKSVQQKQNERPLYEELWLASSSICDTIITSSMIFLLKKSDSGHRKETNRAISQLIQLLIENGFLTALLTVGDLGVMMKFPNQLYHFPICAICASLHSVTLLIYLNSRSYITLSTDSKATWKQSIHFAQPGGSGSSSELSSEAITELVTHQVPDRIYAQEFKALSEMDSKF